MNLLLPSLETQLCDAGYRHQPFAPVEDLNDAIEAGCTACLCQGAIEVKPYWNGPRLRLVVICHECHATEER